MTARNAPRTLTEDLRAFDAGRERSTRSADARESGRYSVGPSDVGRCRAEIGYRERPPEGYVPDEIEGSSDQMIVGTALHQAFTAIRSAMYPERRYAWSVPIPGLDFGGEIDEAILDIDEIGELKTVDPKATSGPWSWAAILEAPRAGDVRQAMIYGLGYEVETGREPKTVRMMYWHRQTGKVKEHVLDWSRDEAESARDHLVGILTSLELGIPLPRDRRGPGLDWACDNCPAVRHCWNLDALPEGRSAQSALACIDDESTAIALADYAAVKPVFDKAKAALDEAKANLTGLPEGIYDGWALRWSGGSAGKVRTDEKAALPVAIEAVAALAAELNARDAGRESPDEADREAGAQAAAALVLPVSRQGMRAASANVTRAVP